MSHPFHRMAGIVLPVLALLVPASAGLAQEPDRVRLTDKTDIRGEIVAVSPNDVEIRAVGSGEPRRVTMDTVATVEFGDEPERLRTARALLLRRDAAGALEEIDAIDQVMSDANQLIGHGFAGANIHAPIDLARIRGDNLGPEPTRERQRKRGFSGCSGAEDDDQQRRDEVDPRLDRHHVAGFERQVGAQHAQARTRAAGASRQVAARIAHAESDHVAEAVREEQRVRVALDERIGSSHEDAERDESLGDATRRRQMQVAPLGPLHTTGDALAFDRLHERVQVAEERIVAPARQAVGARDVGGVARDLGAGIHEHDVAGPRTLAAMAVDQWVPTVENPLPGGSPDERLKKRLDASVERGLAAPTPPPATTPPTGPRADLPRVYGWLVTPRGRRRVKCLIDSGCTDVLMHSALAASLVVAVMLPVAFFRHARSLLLAIDGTVNRRQSPGGAGPGKDDTAGEHLAGLTADDGRAGCAMGVALALVLLFGLGMAVATVLWSAANDVSDGGSAADAVDLR